MCGAPKTYLNCTQYVTFAHDTVLSAHISGTKNSSTHVLQSFQFGLSIATGHAMQIFNCLNYTVAMLSFTTAFNTHRQDHIFFYITLS